MEAFTLIVDENVLHLIMRYLDTPSWYCSKLVCKFWNHATKKLRALKPHIRVAVIGHQTAGKSLICGNLLYKCGCISAEVMQQSKEEAREVLYRQDDDMDDLVSLQWFMNRRKLGPIERYRYTKRDITERYLETPKCNITLIDTPPLRDFKNTLKGIFKADAAIVVGSPMANPTEWAKETKEMIALASAFGIKQFIVAVSKIDVHYDAQFYTKFTEQFPPRSKFFGFKLDMLTFLPVSGCGDNLIEASPKLSWYNGPTLLQALCDFEVPKCTASHLPLRIPIEQAWNVPGIGTVVVGRLETGTIKPKANTIVTIGPSGITAEVQSIHKNKREATSIRQGDTIMLNLNITFETEVRSGKLVIGDPNAKPPKEVESFYAMVHMRTFRGSFRVGHMSMVYSRSFHCVCRVAELTCKVDWRTGQLLEDSPRSLRSGERGMVKFVPSQSVCIDLYSEFSSLGRFVIVDHNEFLGGGIIKSVAYKGGGGK